MTNPVGEALVAFDSYVKRLAEEPHQAVPVTLYHYTDLPGSIGILTKGQLWATDIRFLNDAKEFALTIDLASDELARPSVAANDPSDRAILDTARKHIRENVSSGVYVVSLTSKRDDLSQWRAYGGAAGTVALGFDSQELNDVMERQGFLLRRVEYDPQAQQRAVEELCRLLLPAWRSVVTMEGPQPLPLDQKQSLATSVVSNRLGWALERLAPFLKHPSFRAEDEWRFIAQANLLEDLQGSDTPHPFDVKGLTAKFRTSAWSVVPHVELSLLKPDGSLGLNELVLGPNPDPATLRAGFQHLLQHSKCDCKRLSLSECPYRKW